MTIAKKLAAERAPGIFLRGMAMGAADVVPGVSGGTVAFITGIYQRLIDSIRAINPRVIGLWRQQGLAAVWRHINGNFLLILLAGIITSIASLARLISYWLEQYPLLLWSFFFGLILAATVHMARQVRGWNHWVLLLFVLGAAMAWGITIVKPAAMPATPLWLFLAGAIAICAMILPGISGSFILLLMGMYQHVLAAISNLAMLQLACFVTGCAVGLLSFSHVLGFLLSRFYGYTLSLLTGFLFGSLYLIWPWKQTLSSYTNRHGEVVPLLQGNVLPQTWEQLNQQSSQWPLCLLMMLLGLFLVLALEKVAGQSGKKA